MAKNQQKAQAGAKGGKATAAKYTQAQKAQQQWQGKAQSQQQGNNQGAQGVLDGMKFEIARELGINLKQGYNGDLSARENGYVGGYMVKRLIQQAEQQIANK